MHRMPSPPPLDTHRRVSLLLPHPLLLRVRAQARGWCRPPRMTVRWQPMGWMHTVSSARDHTLAPDSAVCTPPFVLWAWACLPPPRRTTCTRSCWAAALPSTGSHTSRLKRCVAGTPSVDTHPHDGASHHCAALYCAALHCAALHCTAWSRVCACAWCGPPLLTLALCCLCFFVAADPCRRVS
jgi:hypothetical protein